MKTIEVWVRTRKPDGSYEGHNEMFNRSDFDGAVFTGSPEHPQITLKNGHVLEVYAGNDGEIGYNEEIDNSDPVLIARLKKEQKERDAEYYRLHPDEDPKNIPAPANCRCYEVYRSSEENGR